MTFYAVSSDVIFRREHFGALVVSKHPGKLRDGASILSESGAALFDALSRHPLTMDELVRILNEIYATNEKKCRKDVMRFVAESVRAGHVFLTHKRTKGASLEEIKDHLQQQIERKLTLPLAAPYALKLNPTHVCNQHCTFCFIPSHENSLGTLNRGDWFDVVDDACKNKVFILSLLGGEPLLDFDLLRSILNYASPRMSVGFTTNGAVGDGISESQAKDIARIKYLEAVVSVHSLKPSIHDSVVGVKGAHDKAFRSIKNLVKAGVYVCIQSVLLRQNIDDIVSLMLTLRSLGVNAFNLLQLIPGGLGAKNYFELCADPLKINELLTKLQAYSLQSSDRFRIDCVDYFPFLRNYKKGIAKKGGASFFWERWNDLCSAGITALDIAPNGDVYPCFLAFEKEEFRLGNIKYNSIKELWENKKLTFFRERSYMQCRSKVCVECEFKKICKGGCVLASKNLKGEYFAGDPACPRIQIEDGLWHHGSS